MTDDLDLEASLRRHLRHRAESIGGDTPLGGTLAIRESVRERTATRHRRRMAAASVATVAAVGTGLVLIAREPVEQDVRTKQNEAGAASGLAAGSSTGSSTGSATGSPTGWTSSTVTDDPSLARLGAAVPPGFVLTSRYEGVTRQGSGDRAADLAVAAQIPIGGSLRFVIASVQDSTRLQSGTGGTEVTIAGRPGRVIAKRGATVLTWDVSDTTRALVVTAGVDDAALADWLGSLAVGADGQWGFSAVGRTDLAIVPTVTPTEQHSRSLMWEQAADPASTVCETSGYSLDTVSGGNYEFWASIADRLRWDRDLPASREFRFPATTPGGDAPTVAAFLFDSGTSLMATDGTTVVRLNQWMPQSDPNPAGGVIAGDFLTAPDDAAWAAMAPTTVEPPAVCMVEKKGLEAAGAPPATAYPTSGPLTTEPPTTAPPTTTAGA